MLQRAASSAYSWWWASHIRTKQSKWLEQSMQDMEDKVEFALSLVQEDGDSFAKRAEMYYKNRPELINFIEEAFRSFRAVAERYDSLSTDLQKANTTIATCLPEQVQFAFDDEDDFLASKHPKFSQGPPADPSKIPKAPSRPMKGMINRASKKLEAKKSSIPPRRVKPKSGLTKREAVEEIDKLQKDILSLQTMKEYVKSSYENGISKYFGLENDIMEKQAKVSRLQDEFSDVNTMIDDNEARTLMTEAAIKSCKETLVDLQGKQEKSAEEAQVENQKIEDARQRIESIKHELFPDQANNVERTDQNSNNRAEEFQSLKQEMVGPERKKLEALREKIKEQFKEGSIGPLKVSELADKIDDLVNLVINLESADLAQTVLIERLRTEVNDLQSQIRSLEDNKASLMETRELQSRVRELEKKLYAVQILHMNINIQNNDHKTQFAEAHSSLNDLSEKLPTVEPDEELEKDLLQVEELHFKEEKPEGALIRLPEEASIEKSEEASIDKPEAVTEKQEVTLIEKLEEALIEIDKGEGGGDNELKPNTSETEEKSEEVGEILNASSINSNNLSSREEVATLQNKKEDGDSVLNSDTSGTKEKENIMKTSVIALPNETLKAEVTESDGKSEASQVSKQEDNDEGLPKTTEGHVRAEQKNLQSFEEEMNWQQMLLHGVEDKERILLAEYVGLLRNYKEVKKKLKDEEKKNETLFETMLQLRNTKSALLKKDREIQSLRHKLDLLGQESSDIPEAKDSTEDENFGMPPTEEEEEEIKFLINQPKNISPIEERLRGKIDAVLEENLDFWLRFSNSFHQVRKFKTEVHDLQAEIVQAKKKSENNQDGKSHGSISTDLKAEVRAIYRYLSEKNAALTVWLRQSELLKDELRHRILSITDIQEAITDSLKEGVETEEITFSSHQAAKFHGEVLNMKQENKKVNEELLAGIDHMMALQIEIEKTLVKINAEFKITERKSTFRSFSKVPLRSFLFGIKAKRPKHSLFSYVTYSRSSKKPQ
ncbi:NAB domain-containing protein [Heracleum sosnowskyi]|uniref:NAB domain-containing protein n=1 Tax=Heracleum sosnowskyi TaxID=360622 RepID=A0AAD8JLH7_9APIA|nr:NAB domain-containing protein [Heracleum sosnowskyi]